MLLAPLNLHRLADYRFNVNIPGGVDFPELAKEEGVSFASDSALNSALNSVLNQSQSGTGSSRRSEALAVYLATLRVALDGEDPQAHAPPVRVIPCVFVCVFLFGRGSETG